MFRDTQEESNQGGSVNIVRKGINKVVKVADDYHIDHKLDKLTALEKMEYYLHQGGIDLHMQTNASDGFDSPPQLLEKVLKARLKTFAITDQDTFWGVEDCRIIMEKLLQVGMELPELISAVKLSLNYEGERVYLLAYFPSGGEAKLADFLKSIKEQRDYRNKYICDLLTKLGMPMDFDELNQQGGQVINRVHIATLMMKKGHTATVRSAFEQWLGEGCPAYMAEEYPPISEALSIVKEAGGVTVLAHPRYYHWLDAGETVLYEKLEALQKLGLDGVEVVHGDTDLEISRVLAKVAKELGLLRTAGSNYRGINRDGVKLYRLEDDFREFLLD